jgi:branched-chain amino acid transport system substrate-binding protein
MKINRLKHSVLASMLTIGLFAAPAQAQETFKIGVVTFLSGPAAESFGVPAANGGKVLIDALNAGTVPAPHNKKGFGGIQIVPVIVDEAGGATKQVQELRNLYEREKVDAVIGFVSSGDCLAVAPVAEELKKFLILYDCGTPRIFEERKYNYVFRTAAHGTMDNIGLIRYMKKRNIAVKDVAGINQDYAWGQDSWRDFEASLEAVFPNTAVKAKLWPKFGAGQYGTEISTLLGQNPGLLYSSLWGGDLQSLILQGAPRGLFRNRVVAFSAADHVLQPLGDKMPDGVIIGARGAYGQMSRKSPLNDWLWDAYGKAYPNQYPVQPQYRMVQAILGLKAAVEKAMVSNGGKKPDTEQLVKAMRGLEWDSPGGRIKMALGGGHQAIQEIAFGITKWDAARKMVVLTDIERFPAECVNPPEGLLAEAWIKTGLRGAKCD